MAEIVTNTKHVSYIQKSWKLFSSLSLTTKSAIVALLLITLSIPSGIMLQQSLHNFAASEQGFHVIGKTLYYNDSPFTAWGFNMMGTLNQANCGDNSSYGSAYNLNDNELSYMKQNWGSPSMLRYQVSQPALAGNDSHISANDYLNKLEADVALSKKYVTGIIINVNDEYNGCGSQSLLPTVDTETAWKLLAQSPLANDPQVIFEIYNEPQNNSNTTKIENGQTVYTGWQEWKWGRKYCMVDQSCPIKVNKVSSEDPNPDIVGMQDLVNEIRGYHATNVIIADGGEWAESLENIQKPDPNNPGDSYLLDDPNIVYTEHPYAVFKYGSIDPNTFDDSDWDRAFGNLSNKYPVLVTEWNQKNSATDSLCGEKRDTSFFNYLDAHNIGLLVHAFDGSGATTVRKPKATQDNQKVAWTSWMPTTCDKGGGGIYIQNYFRVIAAKHNIVVATSTPEPIVTDTPAPTIGAPTNTPTPTLLPPTSTPPAPTNTPTPTAPPPTSTPTPTPTPQPLSAPVITSPTSSNISTYQTTYVLTGTKDSWETQILFNSVGNSTTTYPTSTTWQASVTLKPIGLQSFAIVGQNAAGVSSPATQITFNVHKLGDINGDGVVDLYDYSIFLSDYDKTSGFNPFSDMNGDGVINATDFSIFASQFGH